MFWTTLLTSASFYTWYLILLPGQELLYPVILAGFTGLFFIALIPTSLGFAFNSRLLETKPTVVKALLANAVSALALAGLTAFYTGFFPERLNLNLIFPPFWQLVSWSLGAYSLYNIKTSPQPPAPGLPLGSILPAVPAIFLLNFMERPQEPLMALVLCWFILLALSLALEGSGLTSGALVRYDVLFFHSLVPIILAFFLLAAAFFRDQRELLLGARNFILYLLDLLFRFLDKLFSVPPEGKPLDEIIPFIPEKEISRRAAELPLWVVALVLAPIVLFLVVILFMNLWEWFRLRLEIAPTQPKGPSFSPLKGLKLLFLGALFFIKGVLSLGKNLFISFQNHALCLFRKLKRAWADWLPPRTPYQKVLRSYARFLQWGRSKGCNRYPGETPLEYARRLEGHSVLKDFPGKEIRRLTQIFLEARYRPYPVAFLMGEECDSLLKRIIRRSLQGESNPCPADLNVLE